jgi:hypothetical protein
MYIVISNPKRISTNVGFVQAMACSKSFDDRSRAASSSSCGTVIGGASAKSVDRPRDFHEIRRRRRDAASSLA